MRLLLIIKIKIHPHQPHSSSKRVFFLWGIRSYMLILNSLAWLHVFLIIIRSIFKLVNILNFLNNITLIIFRLKVIILVMFLPAFFFLSLFDSVCNQPFLVRCEFFGVRLIDLKKLIQVILRNTLITICFFKMILIVFLLLSLLLFQHFLSFLLLNLLFLQFLNLSICFRSSFIYMLI